MTSVPLLKIDSQKGETHISQDRTTPCSMSAAFSIRDSRTTSRMDAGFLVVIISWSCENPRIGDTYIPSTIYHTRILIFVWPFFGPSFMALPLTSLLKPFSQLQSRLDLCRTLCQPFVSHLSWFLTMDAKLKLHKYMYTCAHLHIHVHICICRYTYIHIYIHTYRHTYIYIHIHIRIYIYIHTHTYMHLHVYVYIYIYVRIHVYPSRTDKTGQSPQVPRRTQDLLKFLYGDGESIAKAARGAEINRRFPYTGP